MVGLLGGGVGGSPTGLGAGAGNVHLSTYDFYVNNSAESDSIAVAAGYMMRVWGYSYIIGRDAANNVGVGSSIYVGFVGSGRKVLDIPLYNGGVGQVFSGDNFLGIPICGGNGEDLAITNATFTLGNMVTVVTVYYDVVPVV